MDLVELKLRGSVIQYGVIVLGSKINWREYISGALILHCSGYIELYRRK